MKYQDMDPRSQVVAAMNRIYHSEMTTLSGGNLSLKEDDGTIWITPSGIDKGTLTPEDIMCVRPDGTVEGKHRPSIELPFHQSMYERRPDAKAIIHAHPPGLVTYSVIRQVPDSSVLPQIADICGKVGFAPYALPGSQKLGDNIANVFAEGYDTVMLENHGAVSIGKDMTHGLSRFETLDMTARALIAAQKLGPVHAFDASLLPTAPAGDAPSFAAVADEAEKRKALVAVIRRSYDRKLLAGWLGHYSARLDEASFLISPADQDRYQIESADLGRAAVARGLPTSIEDLHEAIHALVYRARPDTNSVVTALSPHVMAFAITGMPLNTRVIPECYILLEDMPMVSLSDFFANGVTIMQENPVVIIENTCMVATGGTILNAFDRVEVSEYSAKAVIDAIGLGTFSPIAEPHIDDIKRTFLGK